MTPTFLMVAAFILLLLAAFSFPSRVSISWGWLGLASWCLAAAQWTTITSFGILYVLVILLVVLIILLLLRPRL